MSYSRSRGSYPLITTILAAIVVVAFGSCSLVTTHSTMETVPTITLSRDAARIDTGKSGKYIVYTTGETFENTDNFWVGKWNSSDLQSKFVKDAVCTDVVVTGWRFPMLSMYRNILSANCS